MSVAAFDSGAYDYVALMASLPPLLPPFVEERPPLGRYALERRLGELSEHHAHQLDGLERIMFFHRLDWDLSSDEIARRTRVSLASLESTTLREIAQWRLSIRTLVAAARMRLAGHGPPSGEWGLGPWRRLICAQWSRSDFGIRSLLPWGEQLVALIEAGRALATERLLLLEMWRYFSQVAFFHRFSFEAVGLYVLRWDVVYRATLQDPESAGVRFQTLIDSAVAEVSGDE